MKTDATTTTTFDLATHSHDEMVDITGRVAAFVADCGIVEGSVIVYVPHTTAGVTVNENADPDVVHDMLETLKVAFPWRQNFYQHGEGNSAAHVKSSLVGCSMTIPIAGQRMTLGTWQGIYFCEFDGPRNRRVVLSVTGQKA